MMNLKGRKFENLNSRNYSSFHIILIDTGRTHGSHAQTGKVRDETRKVPQKEVKVKLVVCRACPRNLDNKRILGVNPDWEMSPNAFLVSTRTGEKIGLSPVTLVLL
jgi:ribosomal protein S30